MSKASCKTLLLCLTLDRILTSGTFLEIIISIIAVIAGAEGPKAIGVWTKSDEDWLTDRHQLPNGIPSHDTIGRVLMTIKPSAFQVCFERWSKRLLARIIHQELVE